MAPSPALTPSRRGHSRVNSRVVVRVAAQDAVPFADGRRGVGAEEGRGVGRGSCRVGPPPPPASGPTRLRSTTGRRDYGFRPARSATALWAVARREAAYLASRSLGTNPLPTGLSPNRASKNTHAPGTGRRRPRGGRPSTAYPCRPWRRPTASRRAGSASGPAARAVWHGRSRTPCRACTPIPGPRPPGGRRRRRGPPAGPGRPRPPRRPWPARRTWPAGSPARPPPRGAWRSGGRRPGPPRSGGRRPPPGGRPS